MKDQGQLPIMPVEREALLGLKAHVVVKTHFVLSVVLATVLCFHNDDEMQGSISFRYTVT